MDQPDDTRQPFADIAKHLHALHRQAIREYTPLVDQIFRTKSRDTRHIEQTLDGLLGFCGYDPALVLFKKLCRHYLPIDPAATAEYIYLYREMYDSNEDASSGSSFPPSS